MGVVVEVVEAGFWEKVRLRVRRDGIERRDLLVLGADVISVRTSW